MDPLKITVNTKGICLFCFKPKKSETNQSYTCFNLLLRYLEIDLVKILKTFPSVIPNTVRDKQIIKGDVFAVLCDECDIFMKEFLQWYGNFEKDKSRVDNCVQNLYQVLLASDELRNVLGTQSYPNTEHTNVADNLRQEMIQKCSSKLKSFQRASTSNVATHKNLPSTEDKVKEVGRKPGKDSPTKDRFKKEACGLPKVENTRQPHCSRRVPAPPMPIGWCIEPSNMAYLTASSNPSPIPLSSSYQSAFTGEELHVTMKKELWEGYTLKVEGSVSQYFCLYCATRILSKEDFECHLILNHPENLAGAEESMELGDPI